MDSPAQTHVESHPDAPAADAYRLQEVTRSFGSGGSMVTALAGVTLTIRQGEFAAVVGQSGSGKTTLLQILGALDRPTEGRVEVAGIDMARMSERELARLRRTAIGFIFQQFNLIPTLTARQNVEAAVAASRRSGVDRQARADELLAAVGLTARAGHLPSQLSGGEQQRVAIARALANHPRVLLADEPTGNLDSATGEEILAVLRGLAADQGLTIVLVTHDAGLAATADRVIRLKDGGVVEEPPAPGDA